MIYLPQKTKPKKKTKKQTNKKTQAQENVNVDFRRTLRVTCIFLMTTFGLPNTLLNTRGEK